MYTIYHGVGSDRRVAGYYEEQTVYSAGESGRRAVGEIELGVIYSGTGLNRRPIGQFDDRTVYAGTGSARTPIGEVEEETIYRGVGADRVPVGKVEPASRRAGSALLLLLSSPASSSSPAEARESSPTIEIPADLAGMGEPAPESAHSPAAPARPPSDRKYRVVEVEEYKMIGSFGVGELIVLGSLLLIGLILGLVWIAG